MDCPKCCARMESLDYGTDIKVMRCTGCYGIFCKSQTLQQLRGEWLADSVLDKGSPALGAKLNIKQDILCPECGNAMARIRDSEQAHITLDGCSHCASVFLDAGELTDMKSLTLMDHVRRLLSKLGK
jgi:Zn-finger nucleic acid-binding protein